MMNLVIHIIYINHTTISCSSKEVFSSIHLKVVKIIYIVFLKVTQLVSVSISLVTDTCQNKRHKILWFATTV